MDERHAASSAHAMRFARLTTSYGGVASKVGMPPASLMSRGPQARMPSPAPVAATVFDVRSGQSASSEASTPPRSAIVSPVASPAFGPSRRSSRLRMP